MKYYTIGETLKNGGGQFLVMVESGDDVKKIIAEEEAMYKKIVKLIKRL